MTALGEHVVLLRRQLQTEEGRDEARRQRLRLVAEVVEARGADDVVRQFDAGIALSEFDGHLHLATEIIDAGVRVELWAGGRGGLVSELVRDSIGTACAEVRWDDGDQARVELFEIRAVAS